MRGFFKILMTSIVVLAALGAMAFKYLDYITNLWTRDGQVRANVIQVTPRVSGPIVKLPVKDNQFVKAGDALNQAAANLDQTRDHLKDLEQQVNGAQAAVDQTDSQIKQAESAVKSAEAELIKAKADYERGVKLVKKGDISKRSFDAAKASYDVAGADLDKVNSFWVHGFFRETLVGGIRPGDRAVITLMSYPDSPLTGVVDSIGWGIAQQDGSTGEDLLPSISPTFEWIRLAQRVPVRVHLEEHSNESRPDPDPGWDQWKRPASTPAI